MDPWLIAMVIAFIGVVFHGIFTGLALVATWYFGHVAEKKLLDEAKAIHKEVTDQIAKMNKDAKDYDKIDEFLEMQTKVLTGFRSEIARGMGEILDAKIKELSHAPGSPATQQSTADRLLAMGERAVAGMLDNG